MEDPPKNFFRLGPGREVRLRFAYFVTCTHVIKDESGKVIEIHCTYDPETRGGNSPDVRKVRGTLHWVSVSHAIEAEVRLYDRLFLKEYPEDGGNFIDALNPDSCKIHTNAKLAPCLENPENITYQFERMGYFKKDERNSTDEKNVFIRSVSLRDSWARLMKQGRHQQGV